MKGVVRVRATLTVELDVNASIRSIWLDWDECPREDAPAPTRGDPAPLAQLLGLLVVAHQLGRRRASLAVEADTPIGHVMRRVKQLLLDSDPSRSRSKWVREVLGPHPLFLLGDRSWVAHNALSALLAITGKSVLRATLDPHYIRLEDVSFRRAGETLSPAQLLEWLSDQGLMLPDEWKAETTPGQVESLMKRAYELQMKGEWEQALETYERSADIARDEGRHAEEARALHRLCLIARTRIPPSKVRVWLDRAVEAARIADDRHAEADGLLVSATFEQGEMNLESARGHLEHAILIYRGLEEVSMEAMAVARLGHLFSKMGRVEEAQKELSRAEHLAREAGDLSGVAQSLVPQIGVLSTLGEFERGREVAERARALFAELKVAQGRAIAALASANLELDVDDLDKAGRFFEEAASEYAAIGHRPGEANARWGISECLRREGRLVEARKELDGCLSFCREFENAMGEASVLMSLAKLNLQEDKVDAARSSTCAGLRICELKSIPTIQSDLYRVLGEIESASRNPVEARLAFDQAEKLCHSYRDRSGRANTLMVRGDLEVEHDRPEAIRCFHQAAGIYSELQLDRREGEALERARQLIDELQRAAFESTGTGTKGGSPRVH